MTEAAPEAQPAEAPAEETPAQPEPADTTDWKAEARKWEERAKENRKAAAELEKQRQASMSEAERAIAEAETRGRTAATQDYGKRLAMSEIRAAAADATAELAGVFDYLDLSRFVGDDGEPDTKAIKGFVSGLPKKTGAPAFDGGTRSTPDTQDFNQLLRKAAGRA